MDHDLQFNADGSCFVKAGGWSTPALLKWGGALVAAQWLAVPIVVRALVMLMALDYASGLAAGFIRAELTSSKGLRGLVKKSMVLILLAALHVAESALGLKLGIEIESIVACAYCINEIVSLIENCARAGVPIPSALVAALLKAKDLRAAPASDRQLQELAGRPAPSQDK